MPSRRSFLAAAATVGAAALAGCGGSAATPDADRWPQFGFDAANTASNPAARGPDDEPHVAWVRHGDGFYRNSTQPVVGDAVYANLAYDGIYALDPADGAVRWRDPTSYKALTPALAGDGLVLPGSHGLRRVAADGGVAALGWRFGYGGWRTDLDYPQSPATLADGALVVGIGSAEGAPPGGRVVAVDAGDGTVRWSAPVETSVWGAPAVSDGAVYAAARDDGGNDPTVRGTVHALSLETGESLWTHRLGASPRFDPVDAPVADGERVYVPTGTGPLVALDAATGEEVWRLDPPRGIQASPALSDGVLFVGGLDGTFRALDAGTGAPIWTADAATFYGGPTVGGDGVYAVDSSGTLLSWTTDGSERWRTALDPPVHGSPVPVGGRLFVGTSDGLLYGLSDGD